MAYRRAGVPGVCGIGGECPGRGAGGVGVRPDRVVAGRRATPPWSARHDSAENSGVRWASAADACPARLGQPASRSGAVLDLLEWSCSDPRTTAWTGRWGARTRDAIFMTDVEPMNPVEAFAELGRIKLAEVDIDQLMDKITQLAKRAIPGASEVSVTLLRGDDAHTASYTGELALSLDEWQYEQGHGPCLDASAGNTSLSLPDMSTEARWPDWAQRARQAGAHSSLSIGLPVQEQVTGALNIYATEAHAFDDDAITTAQTFAGYAAVALANAHLYDSQTTVAAHMQKAMESRAIIEQAKGIIMGCRRCTPDEAFAILTKLSQDTNRKLRDVAAALVAQATEA